MAPRAWELVVELGSWAPCGEEMWSKNHRTMITMVIDPGLVGGYNLPSYYTFMDNISHITVTYPMNTIVISTISHGP